MIQHDETEFVMAAQSGDQAAFGYLVQRYQNMVASIALSKTGDVQRSEDLAQQAFLLAWKKLTELKDPRRFGGWLGSITRNLILNSNRHSRRLKKVFDLTESPDPAAIADLPVDSIAKKEQQDLLWATLKNIPAEYREPLILFYREDKSVSQVAELMGLSVDAVKQRLSRGRAMLKNEVEQFVEDILGSSKPSASFSATVLLALPSTSAAAGKTIIQTATLWGAKTMIGKLSLLAAGPVIGILGGIVGGAAGAAGAWYGTKAAEKQATSDEEKKLLWRFYWIIMAETVALTLLSIAAANLLPPGKSVGLFVIIASFAYGILLVLQIAHFQRRQKALHTIYGQPAYLQEANQHRPASKTAFRISLIGPTIGCWAWIIALSAMKGSYIVCGIATALMLCSMIWRTLISRLPVTLSGQLMLQAKNLVINFSLCAALTAFTPYLGMTLSPLSPWLFSIILLAMGAVIAIPLWRIAKREELRERQDSMAGNATTSLG